VRARKDLARLEHVAAALRRLRQRHGISQYWLSVRAGTTYGYVGRVERRTINPTFLTMGRLLDVLAVTWAEFGTALDDEAARQSPPPSLRRRR
jgi:transcriptional regulator with XRE-family HTH domain